MVHKNNDDNDKENGKEIFSTTTVPTTAITPVNDEDLKNRRRKLFRSLTSGSDLAAKLNNSNKLKFRKLLRKKDSKTIKDKQNKIGDKPNPRKIIFRKNLLSSDEKRIHSSLSTDPSVKSLQRQIKSQKNRLLSRKKPFRKMETTTEIDTNKVAT